MKPLFKRILLLLFLTQTVALMAQQYEQSFKDRTTLIQFINNYYTEVVYEENPPRFISARGGFVSNTTSGSVVNLEYNSLFKNDSLRVISIPVLDNFVAVANKPQALDGQWLMGGRMRNGEISYRDTSGPRKTLKVLFNGRFQWIAFNTDTFAFMGTGGGNYSSVDGIYKEEIKFFSRDNSRVGAILLFDYELISGEWHHKGKSSKGVPIHEIWVQREY